MEGASREETAVRGLGLLVCKRRRWTGPSPGRAYPVSGEWLHTEGERLLLNLEKTPGFLASGGEEFHPGPETRLDRSELLCNKVLLKYKGDRESF